LVRMRLSAYLEHGLDPPASEAVVRHLVSCPDCGKMLVNLVRAIGALRVLDDLPSRGARTRRPRRSGRADARGAGRVACDQSGVPAPPD
jgi:anti-sigma factor RsiW